MAIRAEPAWPLSSVAPGKGGIRFPLRGVDKP
jgi:hypothetical protein